MNSHQASVSLVFNCDISFRSSPIFDRYSEQVEQVELRREQTFEYRANLREQIFNVLEARAAREEDMVRALAQITGGSV